MKEHSLSTDAHIGSNGQDFILELLSSLGTSLSVTGLKELADDIDLSSICKGESESHSLSLFRVEMKISWQRSQQRCSQFFCHQLLLDAVVLNSSGVVYSQY